MEDFNSGPGGNGKAGYSVIGDPDGTEVNQAYLGYDVMPETGIRLGRQRIILDNARFVGNVGWRQREQTYDAVRLTSGSLPDTTFDYAYMDNVQNIFGADVAMSNHIINLGYSGFEAFNLGAYGYFLAFNGSAAARAASSQTLGAYLDGSLGLDGFKLLLPRRICRTVRLRGRQQQHRRRLHALHPRRDGWRHHGQGRL
ncbi:alginate export family protein [Thiohalobacter thiocyanaticus]|uniref:alginate export family protein n=1 Tax=Thiohalobacter thiocyanaticus TaxID=585455 RepID=UPI00131A3FE2|nr:alginate export family protein [Thiohalobacter thiocyanaticus]